MLLLVISAVLVLGTIPLFWFVFRQLRKSRELFEEVSRAFDGVVSKLPLGTKFTLDGIAVRVFALQGGLYYRAGIRLRSDPGILVTRKFRRVPFIDALQYSPSRQRFRFQSIIDEQYGFQARDTATIRTLFTQEILDDLATKGRVSRIEIRRKVVRGSFLILSHAADEETKAVESIAILNKLVRRVRRSGLAV